MPSLRDVARQAGVSVATASRVASGSASVRPETRVRVERAMQELLYVPPGRRAETGAIGLLVPDLVNPIFPALAQAMETRATAKGLASILCSTNTAHPALTEAEYVHMLVERRVDGMIFISCEMADLEGDHRHYRQLISEGARIVFVNGFVESLDVPTVRVDERAAGRLATQHLIELGHRRIGVVAGPEHFFPTPGRRRGSRRCPGRRSGTSPDRP
ncbi:MAG: LacI family DNA-binding transcriptional regulator [Candidatus Rokubacteria bacterium]|nr:LacI family DNA-binding transcriptional regulator [Candidatus Rokubacteria bacterium]